MAPQTVPPAESKQQVVILPAQSRQPAQQDSSRSRQPVQSQATPGPPSNLDVALYITFILFTTLCVFSLLFGLPAIFFAIMVRYHEFMSILYALTLVYRVTSILNQCTFTHTNSLDPWFSRNPLHAYQAQAQAQAP